MIALYLVSPRSFSGKSLLTLALGKDALARGKRTRYFKPIGPYPVQVDGMVTDQDALFVNQVLNLDTPLDALCPVPLTEDVQQQVFAGTAPELLSRVAAAYRVVAEGADIVIAGGIGSLFSTGIAHGLPAWTVADTIDARALVVSRFEGMRTVDDLLSSRHMLGDRMRGAVFNAVHPRHREELTATIIPYLERQGIPVFGVLPEDPMIHAIPVSDLVEGLGANVLAGTENVNDLVERFAVGAMNEDAALSHFRKVTNKAVITGGDRSDIQRAALETSTRALILTGGIHPTNIILSAAVERGVPVLLVNDDTMTTVEKVEAMIGHLRIRQPVKLNRAYELVRDNADLDRLWNEAGVG